MQKWPLEKAEVLLKFTKEINGTGEFMRLLVAVDSSKQFSFKIFECIQDLI